MTAKTSPDPTSPEQVLKMIEFWDDLDAVCAKYVPHLNTLDVAKALASHAYGFLSNNNNNQDERVKFWSYIMKKCEQAIQENR